VFGKFELDDNFQRDIVEEIVKTERLRKQAVELDMVCTAIKTLSAVPEERLPEFGIDLKELGAKVTETLETLLLADEAKGDA
jgi:hypothetical protein